MRLNNCQYYFVVAICFELGRGSRFSLSFVREALLQTVNQTAFGITAMMRLCLGGKIRSTVTENRRVKARAETWRLNFWLVEA